MPCKSLWWRKNPKTGQLYQCSCGNCLSCRIAKMQEWKLRLLMEQQYWNDSSFITLTYDDEHIEHLPSSNIQYYDSNTNSWRDRKSLDFNDLRTFLMRYRNDINHQKLKYYACGEYGDNGEGKRPHFHIIMFGQGVNSKTRQLLKDNWRYCDEDRFNGINAGLAYAEADSMLYVTSYVRKKLVSKMAQTEYYDKGLLPPDSRSSAGLGYQYYLDNRERIIRDMCIRFSGKKYPIPKYFVDKDPFLKAKIQKNSYEYNMQQMEMLDVDNPSYVAFKGFSSNLLKGTEDYYTSSNQFNLNIEKRLSLFQKNNNLEVIL